jgi:hypothetical protein
MDRAQELTAMEMKMQTIIAILCLALLMWVEAASAQSTYSLTVSRHSGVPALNEVDVKDILAKASRMLQKNPDHVDTEDDVACNVTFTLMGPVRTFASPDTPAMVDGQHIDAVHRVDSDVGGVHFHIKVVDKITNFCRRPNPLGFHGCAFPPDFRSIIVVHPQRHTNPDNPSGPPLDKFPDHLLWAHEFGHLTGLGHRNDRQALMTACPLNKVFFDVPDARVQVNRNECSCLRSGLGSCLPLPPALGCQ